jgi:hypothetical protein
MKEDSDNDKNKKIKNYDNNKFRENCEDEA